MSGPLPPSQETSSAELLQSVLQAAPVGIALVSPDLRYLQINDALASINSRSPEQHIGKTIREIVGDAAADVIEPLLRHVMETGIPMRDLEASAYNNEGELRTYLSQYVPVRSPQEGQVTGVVCVVADITERKQGELALGQQRRLYEAILNNTPDLAYIFGLDHRFIYANDVLLRMWGKTWDEAIGKNCLELGYEPWHAEMHDREIEQVKATKQPVRGEVPFSGTFGRRFYDYIFVPVIGEDGEVEAVAGTTRDVTDYRLSQEALKESEGRLEARVEERTAELQAANQEMEGFTYTVSHDLRAPLRAIVFTSRVLLEEAGGQLSEDHRHMLERQAENASKLAVLIDALLRFSRLSRQEMHRSSLDLSATARQIVTEIAPDGGERFQIQSGMTVEADPQLVKFLLLNLMENAQKFSPDGGAIEVGETAVQGERVFHVRDHGVGFDMKYAHKVFLPFERLVTDSEFPGTGIGLANVHRIVQRHGGRVWVETEPGEGTTFFFTLDPGSDR